MRAALAALERARSAFAPALRALAARVAAARAEADFVCKCLTLLARLAAAPFGPLSPRVFDLMLSIADALYHPHHQPQDPYQHLMLYIAKLLPLTPRDPHHANAGSSGAASAAARRSVRGRRCSGCSATSRGASPLPRARTRVARARCWAGMRARRRRGSASWNTRSRSFVRSTSAA